MALLLFLAVAAVGAYAVVSMQSKNPKIVEGDNKQEDGTKPNINNSIDDDKKNVNDPVSNPNTAAKNQVEQNPKTDKDIKSNIPKTAKTDPQPVPKKADNPVAKDPAPQPVKIDKVDPAQKPVQVVKLDKKKVKKVVLDPMASKYRQLLPPKKQEAVNVAIEKGVQYIRSIQAPFGDWGDGRHDVGHTALAGLTLLECGADGNDPAVRKAAAFVREKLPQLNHTYQLSLAILFLDKLRDPQDSPMIRVLALRLIAGQTTKGGWNYTCPILSDNEAFQLITFLRNTSPIPLENLVDNGDPKLKLLVPIDAKVKLDNLFPKIQTKGPGLNQIVDKGGKKPLIASAKRPLVPTGKTGPGGNATRDSKEKFVIFPEKSGLPRDKKSNHPPNNTNKKGKTGNNAKRPKKKQGPQKQAKINPQTMPVSKPFPKHRLDKRLQQFGIVANEPIPKAYRPKYPLKGGRDDNSNSQFAMMALWAARRHGVPMSRTIALVDQRFLTSQRKNGWSYRYERGNPTPSMTCVGLIGLAMGHASHRNVVKKVLQINPRQPKKDLAIQWGLHTVGKHIGEPGDKRMQNLYYLWSLERVAMLYSLKTIDKKDWYHWASDILVANQHPEGSWNGGGYPGANSTLDTCFALLILRRANLVEDLTEDIREIMPVEAPGGVLRNIVPENRE